MPSREEIAEWLLEAAKICENSANDFDANRFKRRAAQVAAMRCETCKHRTQLDYCVIMGEHMNDDEGCFAHEPKPAD